MITKKHNLTKKENESVQTPQHWHVQVPHLKAEAVKYTGNTKTVLCNSVPGFQEGWDRDGFLGIVNFIVTNFAKPWYGKRTAEDVINAIDYNYSPWPYVEDQYENRHQIAEVRDW